MSFDIDALRAQFPILNREVNGQPLHYLDNAATTFCPQPVTEAVVGFETGYRANVARGVHSLASEATDAYEGARASVVRYLNADDAEEVVFTSGTTGSINLLAHCLEPDMQPGDEVVVSLAEHHSNFVPWQRLCERTGAQLKVIPVDDRGCLDLTSLEEVITERCRLVAVTHASNVTGAVSDIVAISRAAKRQGAKVVVDGAQAVPHGPVDVQALGVDFYAFSGHKCYGPTGVGVLWGRKEVITALPPFMVGGGMVERVTLDQTRYLASNERLEAGTPPIGQAIGLGVAVEWLMALPWAEIRQQEQQLMQRLAEGLNAIPGMRVLGPEQTEGRFPIYSFDIADCHPHDICHIVDQQGVALRGGHHCAQPLMDALEVMATTRASLAVFNNEQDIDALIAGLQQAVEILR